MRFVALVLGVLVAVGLLTPPAWGQNGTISGTVTEAETGNPLPGVNVVLVGETQGATTDENGLYTILNVTPGTYTVRATFVGFADAVVEQVDVNADLTTTVDLQMQEETQELSEVVVTSQQPVVRPDVSANVANVEMSEVADMPVVSVEEIVGLQAGIEPGLQVRGGDRDNLQVRIDGLAMGNPRTNSPLAAISYTSVKQMQVQTGGFNAEYGNLRSGLVNVTLKEGPRDRYTVDALARYSPDARKYFGTSPSDPDSYYMRPYLDEDVAFVGTHSDESPWDTYMRRQYPQWQGYEAVAENWAAADDLPDLSPSQIQEVFEWYHRKDFGPTYDYDVDASIGGPIPAVAEALGDLRFFASYRQTQSSYVVPKLRDAYRDRTFQLKLTSNVTNSIKLDVISLASRGMGMNAGGATMYDGQMPPYPWSGGGLVTDLSGVFDLYANADLSLMNVDQRHVGATWTHTLSANTFYQAKLQRQSSDYLTYPGPERDPATVRSIGGYELDEAPFGFYNDTWLYSPASGMAIGGVWATERDSSNVARWTGSLDVTHQWTPFSQLKGGVDFWYTDFKNRFKNVAPAFPIVENRSFWHRRTWQGAAYVQDKLEFEGLIANVGARLDYFQPVGEWWDYDPFSGAFATNTFEGNVDQSPIDGRWKVSPRVGVSFPVTASSKLYFNYGHFRGTQDTQELFQFETIQGETKVSQIGNPNLPMETTVAYELGYDQNLLDQFLLRISGYYKAQSHQPRDVWFTALGGETHYQKTLPLNYGDVRGAEFTLSRNRGSWLRGFANFTFMVRKSGNFGFGEIFENRALMRDEVRETFQHYQEKPVPQPYARLNLDVIPPSEFGPEVAGGHPLAGLRVSMLADWREGQALTWTNNQNLDIENNVRWRDYYMVDFRLSKEFNLGGGSSVRFFVDLNNPFNIKHMYRWSAFQGSFDFEEYMQSLHLPKSTFEGVNEPYQFVYGDDEPGDFRSRGVEFVPIEVRQALPDEGVSRTQGKYGPLYYETTSDAYFVWSGGGWTEADPDRVDEVLEEKAYIDMPNSRSFTFLNPRDVYFGIRVSF